jgi:hypothetical protein
LSFFFILFMYYLREYMLFLKANTCCAKNTIGHPGRVSDTRRHPARVSDTRVSDTLGLRSQVPTFGGGGGRRRFGFAARQVLQNARLYFFAACCGVWGRPFLVGVFQKYMLRKKHDRTPWQGVGHPPGCRTPGCRTPSVSGPRSRLLEGGGVWGRIGCWW